MLLSRGLGLYYTLLLYYLLVVDPIFYCLVSIPHSTLTKLYFITQYSIAKSFLGYYSIVLLVY